MNLRSRGFRVSFVEGSLRLLPPALLIAYRRGRSLLELLLTHSRARAFLLQGAEGLDGGGTYLLGEDVSKLLFAKFTKVFFIKVIVEEEIIVW